jgi:uncharacterized protein YqiB (DUF1249 family)
MSLYESNFMRLQGLCGDAARLPAQSRSMVEGDCELLLTVIEQTPYTTQLNLTYLLPVTLVGEGSVAPAQRWHRLPDLTVRVYADARLAEATDCARYLTHPQLAGVHNALQRQFDQRWTLNMMLNKWLEYCLDRGHRFGSNESAT